MNKVLMPKNEDALEAPKDPQPKSFSEPEGSGDKRMTPSDVDVLDNLINAQAAFLDAMGDAFVHFGIHEESELANGALADIRKAFLSVAGGIVFMVAAGRI